MNEEILAYCVKEKTKKPMKDAHLVTLKNGKKAYQGVCSSCGTKMNKFVSSKSPAPSATESDKITESSELVEPLVANLA